MLLKDAVVAEVEYFKCNGIKHFHLKLNHSHLHLSDVTSITLTFSEQTDADRGLIPHLPCVTLMEIITKILFYSKPTLLRNAMIEAGKRPAGCNLSQPTI